MSADEKKELAIFTTKNGEIAFDLDPENDTLWASLNQIAEAFDSSKSNVSAHLKNIFESGECDLDSTVRKIRTVQNEGSRNVGRTIQQFNLDAVLSVGYRINSVQATQFRQWASVVLRTHLVHGFTLDEGRLAASVQAQRQLATRLRTIRMSESNVYAKVREVFKSAASDYDKDSQAARTFFSMAQDKFHFAITQKTAAEIVLERADHRKPKMGLMTVAGDHPTQVEVTVGKNYLDADELEALGNISEQFLLFAEAAAFRGKKMTMEELSFRLNTLLQANDYPVLFEYGEFKRARADAHAKRELTKYEGQLKAPGRKALRD